MNYELLALVVTNLIVVAVAWGRREAMHKQNSSTLREIHEEMKQISGSVERHKVVLEHHAREIDRLRDHRRD